MAKLLAERLGLVHRSSGDFMRAMAAERGISVLALSAKAENDSGAIDRAIDEQTKLFDSASEGFVMDSRLGWYFVPCSTKVFLDVDLEVAAFRVFSERRGIEIENIDLSATIDAMEKRLDSESNRYSSYYGINWLDLDHYDLVIDTSLLDIDVVVDEIIAFVNS